MKKNLLIILALSFTALSSVQAQIISTVVGKYFSGVHSGDGGPATNAGLDHPFGVAIDSRGNLYVSEYMYYIRKIDHDGIITTIAGNGNIPGPLGDGGPATAAYIDMVTDLAMDASDNLYIVDHGNSRIRKINKAGIITSVVGGGSATADGVMATNAKCENPNGMTVDAAGNLYIAVGSVVRKVDASTGKINTIAGNGTPGYSGDGGAAAAARLDGAYDVAINKAGELFITDQNNNTIRKVGTSGIISTIAGSASLAPGYGGDGGPAVASVLNVPWGIAVDVSGNVLFADSYNNLIRKIDVGTNIITTVAGFIGGSSYSGDGGPATAAQCGSANVAIDCGNNLFLPGSFSHVRKVTYTNTPLFNATKDTLQACMSAPPKLVDTLLTATDPDIAYPLDWTVDVAPAHGTIGGVTYSTLSTGSTIMPSGITYTPAPGYLGLDSFTIMVGYCSQVADWRKVYVNVNPVPTVANITGDVDTVCRWRTIVLSDATPGGVWSVATTAAVVSGPGLITAGAYGGVVTAQYTVTNSVGCPTTKTFDVRIIECITEVNSIANTASINVYPNPANQQIHIDGLQTSANYRMLNMVGRVVAHGSLAIGNNEISMIALPRGLYMLEVTDAVSGTITKKIVKE